MWPEFFLQTLLGLVINEVWDFTVDKIKKVYKEHKNVPEYQKTFQSRMYTAIIDAFCEYTRINPDEAQDNVMDFIYRTAKEYFDQSYKNQNTTIDALLSAIKTLESRFDNTLLDKENTENINKVLFISDYIQRYIAKDQEFRHIYVIEALDYLRRIGFQIKENQLDLKLFAEEAINKAEQRLAVLIGQNSDRVIEEIKRDNKKQTDEIKQDNREQTEEIKQDNREQIREQTKEILTAIDKSSQHDNTEKMFSRSEEKSEFNDVKTKYVDKWNERLFLHRGSKDEELTLKYTYIPPLYETIRIKPNRGIIAKPQDNLNERLDQFVDHGKSLLIIGPPGIGKTSIVCYLADKYKNDPDVIILRFNDWTEKEWADLLYKTHGKTHGSLLAKAIICKLGVTEKDLQNKLLILDGFDEIKYYSDSNDLLNSFLLQIRNIQGLHVIITSRENYINIKEIKFQNIVRLRPFDEEKIKKYAKKITGCNKFNKKSIGDTEVYGIPVILYMALTSGIDISKEENRCSAYEKIFSLDGGIFDRFATESDPGYDEYASHDIAFIKEAFYNILCKTAYVMFENAFEGVFIDRGKYEEIINEEGNKMPSKTSLWYDFPIDNLYEKGNIIQFVHKSIYEYFAAEYLYKKIIDYTLWQYNFSQNKHYLSNKKRQRLLRPRMIKTGKILLASYLKRGSLSIEILDFLKYKIHMLSCKDLGKLYFENVFCDMIINGMMSGNKYYEDGYILENETIIFSNILKFLHLWVDTNTDVIRIKKAALQKITVYINLVSNLIRCSNIPLQFYSATSKLDLSNFDLRGCDFSNITVPSDTNFSNSILTNVTFNNSILTGCKFENTTAIGAIMQNADLRHTNFRNANVIKANFSGADISQSNFACSSVAEAILTGAKTEKADFRDVSGMDTAIYTTEYKGMILNDPVWEDINIHNGRYSNSSNVSRRK